MLPFVVGSALVRARTGSPRTSCIPTPSPDTLHATPQPDNPTRPARSPLSFVPIVCPSSPSARCATLLLIPSTRRGSRRRPVGVSAYAAPCSSASSSRASTARPSQTGAPLPLADALALVLAEVEAAKQRGAGGAVGTARALAVRPGRYDERHAQCRRRAYPYSPACAASNGSATMPWHSAMSSISGVGGRVGTCDGWGRCARVSRRARSARYHMPSVACRLMPINLCARARDVACQEFHYATT